MCSPVGLCPTAQILEPVWTHRLHFLFHSDFTWYFYHGDCLLKTWFFGKALKPLIGVQIANSVTPISSLCGVQHMWRIAVFPPKLPWVHSGTLGTRFGNHGLSVFLSYQVISLWQILNLGLLFFKELITECYSWQNGYLCFLPSPSHLLLLLPFLSALKHPPCAQHCFLKRCPVIVSVGGCEKTEHFFKHTQTHSF